MDLATTMTRQKQMVGQVAASIHLPVVANSPSSKPALQATGVQSSSKPEEEERKGKEVPPWEQKSEGRVME